MPSQNKLRIRAKFLNNQFSFFIKDCISTFDINLKDIKKEFLILCGTPANDNLKCIIYFQTFDSVIHNKEIIDKISKFLKLLVRFP